MTEFERLVKEADKAARDSGGLIAILLAVRSRRARDIAWDPKRARFKVDGKIIPITRIRAELSRIELKIANTIISYNTKLFEKEWTLNQWQKAMEALIRQNHMIYAALAVGGIVLAARQPTTTRRIARDVSAIDRFSQAIKNERYANQASVNVRGKTYVRSWWVTYHVLSHRMHILGGYTEAKRVLTPAEHCRTKHDKEGCWEVALKGWMPIEKMPPIGTLRCMQFCKCWIRYRK